MDFEGRNIVVTGAAGGIGGSLVRGVRARGARTVVASDLDGAGLERLSSELGEDAVLARVLDVREEAATLALVQEIESTVGPIDMWFANAGLASGTGADGSLDDWDRQWQINVM